MKTKDQRAAYLKWLRAAYLYYIVPGGESEMHDLEWDALGRKLFLIRDHLDPQMYPVLFSPKYEGGSLFWLRAQDYPEEVKQP